MSGGLPTTLASCVCVITAESSAINPLGGTKLVRPNRFGRGREVSSKGPLALGCTCLHCAT